MTPRQVVEWHSSRELTEWRAYFAAENRRNEMRKSQREQEQRVKKGRQRWQR